MMADSLACALQELQNQLQSARLVLQRNQQHRHETQRLLARFRRRNLQDSSKAMDNMWYDALADHIGHIQIEVPFLKAFLCYVDCWANMEYISLPRKVSSALYGIAEDLKIANEKSKFELCTYLPDYPFWIDSVSCLSNNLETILDTVDEDLRGQVVAFQLQLRSFQTFLNHVVVGFLSFDKIKEQEKHIEYLRMWTDVSSLEEEFKNRLPNGILDGLTRHVASVVIRLANFSCFYWFKKMNPIEKRSTIIGILNLQEEIDPTNPEFLELNLNMFRGINKINSHKAHDKVTGFLRYLLNKEGGFINVDELKSLVEFLVNQPEKPCYEVESFVMEIKEVVKEAGSLINSFDGVRERPPKAELAKVRLLKVKIWLLNAEHFLKGLVNSSNIFSSKWKWKREITSLNEVVKSLTCFSKDLPEEKKEVWKQKLALIEEVHGKLQSLFQSILAEEFTQERLRESFFELLLKILLFKAELFLEILNVSANSLFLQKDHIEDVHEGLKFLMRFVTNQPEENADYMEPIFSHIEAVARRVIYFCYAVLTNKVTEKMIWKTDLELSDLLDQIKLNQAKLEEILRHL
ncbi:hypothetical protein ACH5RR_009645 [Cinchona calisaya]|uniref:Uncharacterized protein n=1 Tax=Cinchona calisaya TaxID=153742 RepID=A0ABD3AFL0_9GENT